MAGDEMVNGMSNGKDMGADGRSEHLEAHSKNQQQVARASRDVVDLSNTAGLPPNSGEADSPIKVHLVDVKKMAKILDVPESAIYEHTRKRTIPHVRFGKYCRFNPAEVIAYFRRPADQKEQK